jgi:hypothetical protein
MFRNPLAASVVLSVSVALLSISPAAQAEPPNPMPDKPPVVAQVSDCEPPNPQPNDPPCQDKLGPVKPKPPLARTR